MLSNKEKERLFQEKCKILLESEFATVFDREVRIELPDGRPHVFDLATAEHDVVAECKAYSWTESGNIPSAKISNLREALDLLRGLPDSTKTFLIIKKDPHPIHKETLADYFAKLDKKILGRVNVLEVSEVGGEIILVYGSLERPSDLFCSR